MTKEEKPIENLEITTEQNFSNTNLQDLKKKHRKKILGNVFLFSSLSIALVSLIAIPLTLNKKAISRKDAYFFDNKDSVNYLTEEVTKDKEYNLKFASKIDEKNNIANKILNKSKKIETLNPFKALTPPLIKYISLYDFKANKNSIFDKYNLINPQYEQINTFEFNFGTLNFLKLLTDHYKNEFKKITDPIKLQEEINKELTFEKTIGLLNNLSFNFTFVHEKNKSYYYSDLNNDYKSILVHYFLEQINNQIKDFIKKYSNKKVSLVLTKAIFSLKSKLSLDKTKIEELYFDHEVIFNAKITD